MNYGKEKEKHRVNRITKETAHLTSKACSNPKESSGTRISAVSDEGVSSQHGPAFQQLLPLRPRRTPNRREPGVQLAVHLNQNGSPADLLPFRTGGTRKFSEGEPNHDCRPLTNSMFPVFFQTSLELSHSYPATVS